MACPCRVFGRTKIGCLCFPYRVHRASVAMHAGRVHTSAVCPGHTTAAAYQRSLICPLSMGCDHEQVCAARSTPLDRNWLERERNFPHAVSSSIANAGRVGCCRCRSARALALSSSDCASFSWAPMGKLSASAASSGEILPPRSFGSGAPGERTHHQTASPSNSLVPWSSLLALGRPGNVHGRPR